ncbi:4266_t:CDS:2, partial [Entrophospora sp. SA101]
MSSLSALMSSNELTFQCAIHEKWTLLLLFVRAVPALVLLNNQLEGNSSSSSSSSDSKEIEIFVSRTTISSPSVIPISNFSLYYQQNSPIGIVPSINKLQAVDEAITSKDYYYGSNNRKIPFLFRLSTIFFIFTGLTKFYSKRGESKSTVSSSSD